MKPHPMFAAIASTVTDRLTLFKRCNRSHLAANPMLNSWLFQHPELEHPELLLTQMPKEAAFSSLIDSDLRLRR